MGCACSEDARVALLESVHVALVLQTGRETGSNRSTTTGQCSWRMGTFGRSRFAGRVAQPGGDVEELPSFPPGQCERVFRCRCEGETPCQIGGRRFVRNQSIRDELAQRVVKFQRDQWAQLIREANKCSSLPVSFHQEHPKKKPFEGVWPPRAECRGGKCQEPVRL